MGYGSVIVVGVGVAVAVQVRPQQSFELSKVSTFGLLLVTFQRSIQVNL